MGNKVPVPDERMQKTIDMLKLEKTHIRSLFKRFRSHDKDRSGTIDIDEFYHMINEPRTVFGDSLFELVDIDNNGTLDFSEFVQTLSTYCMFGREDVLKYCFFVFDKDKNGYIEQDELHALIEMLWANKPNSNCKIAMEKFDTNKDGKIDFAEFNSMNTQYPQLLFPAYRMQENMMENTLGMVWWKKKKESLMNERKNERRASERLRLKELKRQRKIQQREVKHKMGALQYYLCFWKRQKYLAQVAAEAVNKKKKKKKRRRKNDKADLEEKKKKLAEMFKGKNGGGKGDEDGKRRKKKKKKKKRKPGESKSTKEERKHRHDKRKKKKMK